MRKLPRYAGGASLAASLLCATALVSAGPALAGGTLPSGGHYVAGQGGISGSGNGLTVTQSSTRGIVDWHSFSIGSGNSVQFNNGSGATLNRVSGGSLSRIDGSLSATGSVYLINPQGIVVGPGGKVVTGGSFVASTRDISNSDFMAGGAMTVAGTSNGGITNAGVITSKTGDAILVGRSVTNDGSISAPNGAAALAAGDEVVLQPVVGDGRIAVSAGHGAVTNSGAIKAAQAALSSGGDIYGTVENNGAIAATGAATVAGHVWLTGGTTQTTGTIAVTNADGSGGNVTVRGNTIDLSGTIDASAMGAGKNGGDVSAIATGTTAVSGAIKARGGQGGSGGHIETSGAQVHVADGATIDTMAPGGTTGTWLLDPTDYTIAASGGDITGATLSSNLATTDVTIRSTHGATTGHGDVLVNDNVSWSSDHTLTLDAARDIDFNADVKASGSGAGLALNYHRDYSFAPGASVTLSGGSASLTINSASYTLLGSISDIAGINGSSGNYALAHNINASGAGTFSAAVAQSFAGMLAGLGHWIVNLDIDDTASSGNVGLIGSLSGTVRDLGLRGGTISGGNFVGALAGDNQGTISDSYATSRVSDGAAYTGGLVGSNDYSGTIENSYATGPVSGGTYGDVGGLAGSNWGSLSNSYATGAVSGGQDSVGGLVGSNDHGSISKSFATGAVRGGDNAFVGGLVGLNYVSIDQSFATGAVSDSGTSAVVGGLVGQNTNAATLTNAYATGAVSGGSNATIGGLVGYNGGAIKSVYATGTVSGTPVYYYMGGLVGQNSGGTIARGYWDTDTSGTATGIGHDDNSQTVTGLTTAQLASAPPVGFPSTVWDNERNQTTPYLKNVTQGSQPVYFASGDLYHLLFDVNQLQAIANDLSANYALATEIDASTSAAWNSGAGFTPLGDETTPFTGTFNGLGHTVDGLTIDNTTVYDIGLFGASSGTIEDVGLVGGSVTAGEYAVVGELLGFNNGGSVANAYATGTVTDTENSARAGGLVGANYVASMITDSYATGAVSGGGSLSYIGGLVGGNSGTVSRSFASGAVNSGGGDGNRRTGRP